MYFSFERAPCSAAVGRDKIGNGIRISPLTPAYYISGAMWHEPEIVLELDRHLLPDQRLEERVEKLRREPSVCKHTTSRCDALDWVYVAHDIRILLFFALCWREACWAADHGGFSTFVAMRLNLKRVVVAAVCASVLVSLYIMYHVEDHAVDRVTDAGAGMNHEGMAHNAPRSTVGCIGRVSNDHSMEDSIKSLRLNSCTPSLS